jgi:Na+/proline symporter/signal transduction histidine kinase/CheY-like chemotaxis protein
VSTTTLSLLAALLWAGALFGVALAGERRWRLPERAWAAVYALSLAVYCTSWTFYGTVAQAAAHGWAVPPTFIGTIALFALGLPFLERLARLAREQNSTSIADLLASRFGKSPRLAALVTAVAVVGMVPYIALQLRAVAQSFALLTAEDGGAVAAAAWQDIAFWVALLMAAFAMLFGTRRAAATEHNRGLVLAMGFESLFKLLVLLALGAFAVWEVGGGPRALVDAARALPPPVSGGGFLALVLLGALAMFTLPHQFHIGFVELREAGHLRTARWLFPLYLLLIAAPILPLAWAGQLVIGGMLPADLHSLALPLSRGAHGLALAAFLGGLSAATGMVIMAAITLSIMIGNHWLAPAMLRGAVAAGAPPRDLRGALLGLRRVAIAAILLLAWAYSRAVGESGALADIGALSFSALAHLAPGVVAALYAPHLPARAVAGGLLAGLAAWAWLLLVPAAVQAGVLQAALLDGAGALAPDRVLGLQGWDPLTRAVLLSLAANALVLLLLGRGPAHAPERETQPVAAGELRALAARFLPPAQVERALGGLPEAAPVDAARVAGIERDLAAVVGAASARWLLDAARRGGELAAVAEIVGEASAAARFNQALLEAALENMSQGISVVDRDLRLVAWNQRYADLFDYPPELLAVGTPVEALVRHNARRGLLGPGDIEALVARRLSHMRAGTPYVAERVFADGTVVEIRGNPMPGGGFVATFTDVTAFRRAQQALEQANLTLEERVAERTRESVLARDEAERANRAKSRFLAAVSHDLLQPINAAHLFTHALAQRLEHPQYRAAVADIDGALTSTESLLAGLLDISRLDAGGLRPRIDRFPLAEVLDPLAAESGVLARGRGLTLSHRRCSAWVESDPQLLRRVVQNFLSNAVRYALRGRVLLGCRRVAGALRIEVWDTGPGIAESDRAAIFEEFRRLERPGGSEGLGLGLAIADRIARLLGHRIGLRSWPGRGSVFWIEVPRVAAAVRTAATPPPAAASVPRGRVLVVDNDLAVLRAMQALVGGWDLTVDVARDRDEALAAARRAPPDLLLLDYHLDAGATGLDLHAALCALHGPLPAVVLTADHGEPVRAAVAAAGLPLLMKPVKPLALRSLMGRLLAARAGLAEA